MPSAAKVPAVRIFTQDRLGARHKTKLAALQLRPAALHPINPASTAETLLDCRQDTGAKVH